MNLCIENGHKRTKLNSERKQAWPYLQAVRNYWLLYSYVISYKSKLVSYTYYYSTAHIVHLSIDYRYVQCAIAKRIQYKLVGLANLYEIFKDKIFGGA